MPSFRIAYPKLALLCCSFVLAYALYAMGIFDILPGMLHGRGYISVFLAGILFSMGFTAPFGLFMLIEMSSEVHPFLGALVGGLGALLVDMTIFHVARFSLHDELRRLASKGFIRFAISLLYHERMPDRLRKYLVWSFAGIIIASPLPDEIGVTLLSGISTINARKLTLFCYVLDTIGVLSVLGGARLIAA